MTKGDDKVGHTFKITMNSEVVSVMSFAKVCVCKKYWDQNLPFEQ